MVSMNLRWKRYGTTKKSKKPKEEKKKVKEIKKPIKRKVVKNKFLKSKQR